jgi:hypothetical protein
MNNETTIKLTPFEVIQPVPGVRYVKRWTIQEHGGDSFNVQTLVLQQKFAGTVMDPETGKMECVVRWVDVPEETE